MPRVNRIDPKIDPKLHAQIDSRYIQFLDNCNDINKPVIRVFEPLSKRHMDAIEICREVTKTLMAKKEEDMQKAAAAAEEAEREKEEAKKLALQKKKAEENSEVTEEVKEVTEDKEKKQE